MSIGLRQFLYNTARVCGRKKLPCAEYPVVKDQSCQASPGNLFTSGTGRSATRAALKPSVPTSVQERLAPHHSTETFSAFAAYSSFGATGADYLERTPSCQRSLSPLRAGLPSRSRVSCYGAAEAGGEYRSRTGDLLVANQALSQLS